MGGIGNLRRKHLLGQAVRMTVGRASHLRRRQYAVRVWTESDCDGESGRVESWPSIRMWFGCARFAGRTRDSPILGQPPVSPLHKNHHGRLLYKVGSVQQLFTNWCGCLCSTSPLLSTTVFGFDTWLHHVVPGLGQSPRQQITEHVLPAENLQSPFYKPRPELGLKPVMMSSSWLQQANNQVQAYERFSRPWSLTPRDLALLRHLLESSSPSRTLAAITASNLDRLDLFASCQLKKLSGSEQVVP